VPQVDGAFKPGDLVIQTSCQLPSTAFGGQLLRNINFVRIRCRQVPRWQGVWPAGQPDVAQRRAEGEDLDLTLRCQRRAIVPNRSGELVDQNEMSRLQHEHRGQASLTQDRHLKLHTGRPVHHSHQASGP
jgi:hypothetical protein